MRKMRLAGGISALLLAAGITMGYGVCAEASSQINLGKERIFNSPVVRQQVQVKTYPTINVGYIVVGDDAMILDDLTMGYIRRMLNVKFPGDSYPPKRLESTNGIYQHGRRNYSDRYNLVEARDVQMKELEKLERMYQVVPKEETTSNTKTSMTSNSQALASVGIFGIGVGVGGATSSSSVSHGSDTTTVKNTDSLGVDNSYSFTEHLSMLPKEDYVSFARQLAAEGKSDYDYLIMFNIHNFNQQVSGKFLGKSMWNDFCISVRAIDVATGEYIDRREYRKRGYSASGFGSPSWRRGMRRAIVDCMVECFDNLPIGKYSVCDNPYCERRQREIKEEAVLGKSRRHCVNHCHTLDNCDDHLVNYAIDADLPSGYLNNEHERVD